MAPRLRLVTSHALLITLALGLTLLAAAQNFTTTDPPAAVVDNTGTYSGCQTIVVPVQGSVMCPIEVQVSVSHTWVGDLSLRLTSPGGTELTLLNRPGRTTSGDGNSDDLVDTTPILFSDTAASALLAEEMGNGCAGTIGVTPGCPDNYLPAPDALDTPLPGDGTSFDDFLGDPLNGLWTLCGADSAGGDTGTLVSWTLRINGLWPVELESFTVE